MDAFDLELGAEYTVMWDGEAYTTTTQDISAIMGNGTYALGNAAAFDSSFSGNNEPFIIGWNTVGIVILVVDGSTETTHTVGIVQEIEQEEQPETQYGPNDAVLLSYSQNPVEYKNIPKVWLTHPDSTAEDVKLVPFTYGESVSKEVVPDFSGGDMSVDIPAGELVTDLTVKKPEELTPENIPAGKYIAGVGPGTFQGGVETVETTITLDLSGGGMVVVPDQGKAFSKLNIPVPANLIPGNIAEGVNIAGIIGTMAAGGGGSAKFATGIFYSSNVSTVKHNLGVVPDVVFVYQPSIGSSNYVNLAVGVSDGLKSKLGLKYGVIGMSRVSSTTTRASMYPSTGTIEAKAGSYTIIHSATETHVTFGGTAAGYGFATTSQPDYYGYTWVAIGGLT
jgi:hypothetical protein